MGASKWHSNLSLNNVKMVLPAVVQAPPSTSNELEKKKKTFVQCVTLCLFWYLFSACSNNLSKSVMKTFSFPQTLTLVQLASVTFYLPMAMRALGIKRQGVNRHQFLTIVLPLALGRILGSVTASISLWRMPVSYLHTVKAVSPVFTVLMSAVVLREVPTANVLLSLMPIVLGVMLATMTEIYFDWTGLLCALLSTVVFAGLNIYTKMALHEHVLDHLNLLFHTTRLSLVLLFPFWLATDGVTILSNSQSIIAAAPNGLLSLLFQLWCCGFSHFGQNITAFSVLYLVSPVSYSVANTTKRIVIISTSLMIFGNPVTFWNATGMALAVSGVALYNVAKYKNAKRKAEEMLPLTAQEVLKEPKSPLLEYGDEEVLDKANQLLAVGPTSHTTIERHPSAVPTAAHFRLNHEHVAG